MVTKNRGKEELGLNANIYEVSVGSDGNVLKLAAVVTQQWFDDTKNYNLKCTIWNGKCYVNWISTFKMLK